ncbi:MAG: 50S ribosomal protein L28 [Candidatus Omnitrophica bacterium 4484_70.1]|nr:MAG: 50S ribosomal protein L28 [Candidatus Omnitrophica bacterium 4484_70.1]
MYSSLKGNNLSYYFQSTRIFKFVRRGLAKKKKGVGKKTTGITKRKFFPNLQTKRVVVKGEVKKMLICTKCLKKTEPLFPGKV